MTQLKLDTADQWVLAIDECIDIPQNNTVYHICI